MDVTWSCECGEVLKQPGRMAGKEYRCPNCHQFGWVPQPKIAPPRKKAAKKPEPKAVAVVEPVAKVANGFFASVFSIDGLGGFLLVIGVIGLFVLLQWAMNSYLWTR